MSALLLFSSLPLFLLLVAQTHALSCYQGLSNVSTPLSGSATQCPGLANSCIKVVDSRNGQVTRACQATNCTVPYAMQTDQTTMIFSPLNQMSSSNTQQQQQQQQQQQLAGTTSMSTVAVCTNNTQSTFCCCYGDGCNSAPSNVFGTFVMPLLGTVAIAMIGRVLY